MRPIDTQRLLLRNFRSDDWLALQAMIIEYQSTQAASFEDPWPTDDENIRNITNWFVSGDDYLAVIFKETTALIGFISCGQRDIVGEKVNNLGYVFHPHYYEHGYATESCLAVMDYLFMQKNIDRIYTGTHPDNLASVKLLERLGLQKIKPGEYQITRDEWLNSPRENG